MHLIRFLSLRWKRFARTYSLRKLNTKLPRIFNQCKFNKLSLNPDKFEVIFISSRKSDIHPYIHIDGDAVKQINSCKYLGVYIDDRLKFQPHIDHLERKLAQYCGISYRLRNHFNYNTARKFYYSCVYSTFTYCLSVWGGVSQCTSRCERIIKLQKRVVSNLFTKYFLEGNDIFKSAKLLKFGDAYKLKVAIYMFRMTKSGELL